jgi:HPr kinase/phosphorylase
MSEPVHRGQLYGVMVKINQSGILITGKPGIGKSSFALELLQHGHQLIADDNVDYEQCGESIITSCPILLKNMLHTRELGLMNVATLFGDNAVIESYSLDLVIELCTHLKPAISVEGPKQNYIINQIKRPLLMLDIANPASCYHRLLTWLKILENPTEKANWLKQHQRALVNINS